MLRSRGSSFRNKDGVGTCDWRADSSSSDGSSLGCLRLQAAAWRPSLYPDNLVARLDAADQELQQKLQGANPESAPSSSCKSEDRNPSAAARTKTGTAPKSGDRGSSEKSPQKSVEPSSTVRLTESRSGASHADLLSILKSTEKELEEERSSRKADMKISKDEAKLQDAQMANGKLVHDADVRYLVGFKEDLQSQLAQSKQDTKVARDGNDELVKTIAVLKAKHAVEKELAEEKLHDKLEKQVNRDNKRSKRYLDAVASLRLELAGLEQQIAGCNPSARQGARYSARSAARPSWSRQGPHSAGELLGIAEDDEGTISGNDSVATDGSVCGVRFRTVRWVAEVIADPSAAWNDTVVADVQRLETSYGHENWALTEAGAQKDLEHAAPKDRLRGQLSTQSDARDAAQAAVQDGVVGCQEACLQALGKDLEASCEENPRQAHALDELRAALKVATEGRAAAEALVEELRDQCWAVREVRRIAVQRAEDYRREILAMEAKHGEEVRQLEQALRVAKAATPLTISGAQHVGRQADTDEAKEEAGLAGAGALPLDELQEQVRSLTSALNVLKNDMECKDAVEMELQDASRAQEATTMEPQARAAASSARKAAAIPG